MFARSSSLDFGGESRTSTPLLIPSFSSRGFPDVRRLIKYSREFITGPVLVSAYDLAKRKIHPDLTFASVVFLDSGGYEAKKDDEAWAPYRHEQVERPSWTIPDYQSFVRSWKPEIPSVIVSYDSPLRHIKLENQIDRARREFEAIGKRRGHDASPFLREFLIKPEQKEEPIAVSRVERLARRMHEFDIIGVTADEIGTTPLARMELIARLRRALDDVGNGAPIHVFGSLDTVTTPLYFIAGAELFDGLTWLRMGYHEGRTLYMQSRSASMEHGLQRADDDMRAQILKENLYALQSLEQDMRGEADKQSLDEFSYNREFLGKSARALEGKLAGGR